MASAENVPGQIMVKFKPDVISLPRGMKAAGVSAVAVKASSVQALNTEFDVYEIKKLYTKTLAIRPDWTDLDNQYVLIFPDNESVNAVASAYAKNSNVIFAEPVSIVHAFATNPNDPYFSGGFQYGLTNIQAPAAWDRTTGSSGTLIAVLDTGINYNHPDLSSKVNLTDAYDFVNDDNDPLDDYGHGTGVSGVIAAATNNAIGIAGTNWQATILPIKVLDSSGDGTITDINEGIAWVRAKGVDVINMSFGQYSASPTLQQSCLDAYNDGIVLVAAAGNGNVDWATYPAYYSTVIAVAAVDENDERSLWSGTDPTTWRRQASNYGDWISVCAPGSSICSTNMGGGYSVGNDGTSFAAPFVAGVAGLIKAISPSLSNQQIINKITSEADNIDSLNPGFEGELGKRLNAYLAVAGIVATISSPTAGSYVKGDVGISGTASGWDFTNYVLEARQNTTLILTIESSVISIESATLGTWDTTGLNGEYTLHLQVFGTGGGSEETSVAVILDNTVPTAEITSPTAGQTIDGQTIIVGTANDNYFSNYILEYGVGASPTSFERISRSYVAVLGGALATWETTGLDGSYTIKLSVYDQAGASTTNSRQVTIANTAEPTKEAKAQAGLPLAYALPNPFSTTSEISFNYTLEGNFATKIYLLDISGNLIWQKSYAAGINGGKSGANNPSWNGVVLFGTTVKNGVYIFQIVADNKAIARGKLIVLK